MTNSILRNTAAATLETRIPPQWPFDQSALFEFGQSQWQSHIFKRNDPSTLHDVVLRFLTNDDLSELIKLHRAVLAKLPDRHIFRSDKPDFLADHITRRGATVGAFTHGQLIGYAVVSFPYRDADNLARFTNLSTDQALRVAHFDGAAVDPAFRGNKLHQTMNCIRGHYALLAGYHHIMGTVSPLNPFSLSNHLGAGFQVVDHAVCYGDMPRYIIYRNGPPTCQQRVLQPDTHEQQSLPVDAFDTVNQHLERGFVGYAVTRTEDKKYLLQMALPGSIVSDIDQMFRA